MKPRKKIINLIIVGILLVVLSINATYAYFKASIINNFGTKSVTGHLEDNGNVSIRTGANLILDIKNADMKDKGVDTTYYASSSGTTTTETYENIGVATAVGSGSNQCTYKIKVEDKSINSMYTAFQSMESKSEGQIQLIVNGAVYDFNTVGLFPLTITGTLRNIKEGENQNITAGLKLVNKTGMNQNALAETDINLSFTVEELTCTSTDSDIELNATNLAKYENLWDSGLEGDGYRYVGNARPYCSYENGAYGKSPKNDGSCWTLYNYTQTKIADGTTRKVNHTPSCPANNSTYTYECTEVEFDGMININNTNNYICFGTTNKNECINNTNAYMYRIIGIFSDATGNQHMKLIKKEALNTAYSWHSDKTLDIEWENSDLYKKINDTEEGSTVYLKNSTYMPSGWSDRIKNWTWRAINTKTRESSGTHYYYTNPKGIYQNEILMTENSSVTCANSNDSDGTSARCAIGDVKTKEAKIGLMYASDYALSLGTEALSLTGGTYTNINKLKSGWMNLSNNDLYAPLNNYEWTISRFGKYSSDNYGAFVVISNGQVTFSDFNMSYSVRPTFYLNSDEVIASGKGTLLDPFILK